ncbi:MAG: HAMP domain-containing sensor histidine kinase [Myxococcota bacterium]
MNLHDRLLMRSVGVVLVLAVLGMLYGLVGDVRADQVWRGLPIVVTMAVTLGLTRMGFGTLAAWFLTLVSTATLIAYIAVTGGVHSHYTVYLGLVVFAAWIWSGARGGLLATVAMTVALAVLGMAAPQGTDTGFSPVIDIVIASLMSAIWVSLAVQDLREALRQRLASTEALEQAAREAQWDAQARDRFLAMVSHEFRTPLNVVLGYEEMIREEETDPERQKDLERIHAAGQHLLALVDDLIDLSNAEDADLPLAVERVPIAPLLEEVSVITQPLVQLRGNTWELQADSDLPAISVDPRRTFQILLNLVSNAAKYTTNGKITLQATAVGMQVQLAVSDTGVGIAPDKLEDLFEPFAQVQDSDQQKPGLGLGLALSRRWAETMGGQIDVESAVGQGTTFRLRLPVA